MAGLAALGLAVGFLWTGCYALLVRAPAHALTDRAVEPYRLTVSDFPTETSRGVSFPAALRLEGRSYMLRVYADASAADLLPGDEITLPLALARSDNYRGSSYDYYQSKGVFLLGYARDEHTLVSRPERPPVGTWPQYAAKALKDAILRSLPPDVSGMVTAVITGDKSFLPTGMYVAFQRAGLSHVVAVSGLHISFLAGVLALLLGRRSRLGMILTLLAVFFFAALAGNSPSSLRAAIMAAIISIAPLLGREDDKPTTLSAALVVLLLPCPYAAASVSLQLSFAAVAGIYLISGPLCDRWIARIPKWRGFPKNLLRRVLLFCATTMAVTLGALLFTTPLAAIHFHSVSLVGPLTNLLTLWAVSDVFLGGLVTALVGLALPGLASVFGWILAWPARWVILVAKAVSRLPFASLTLLSGYLLLWFLVAYAIVLLWLCFHRKVRPIIPLAAIVLTLCPALITNAWPAMTSQLTVAALNVGQGASTLLYSGGRAVLVDCGGNGADDPGDVAADYLQSLGSSRLDALVLTHFHADHTNGVPELLERLEVPLLIVPSLPVEDDPDREALLALADQYGCRVETLSRDGSLTFGSATLQLFAPLGDGGENEAGLSALCTAEDFDVLMTGDMNQIVEGRLLKYHHLPELEVLVVGHHGSRSSTSEALLLATAPESAVISCGYNSYGHPAPETLERLGAAGCGIYRTDLMGTVTFTFKEEHT